MGIDGEGYFDDEKLRGVETSVGSVLELTSQLH